jgi:hypothetical protein
MAAPGIIKIPVVGAAAYSGLLSITAHGNRPFLRERAEYLKARRVWRQACAETRPPFSGERQKGLGFGWLCPFFLSVTEIEFSDLVVDRCCWCQCFCRSMPYIIGFPESGGEPA